MSTKPKNAINLSDSAKVDEQSVEPFTRSQKVYVTGEVKVKLYKGGVHLVGRSSPYSLYREDIVTFEDDHGAYDQKDAEGFIKLNALRLRILAGRDRKFGKN